MAAGLNGKGSAGYGDDEDIYDGEVVFRVWKVFIFGFFIIKRPRLLSASQIFYFLKSRVGP